MPTLTLQYDEIRKVIDPDKVITAVEDIYGQFYRGAVGMPFPYHFEPTEDSVVHIKSAVRAGDQYVVKVASYFPGNPAKGLTSILGLVMLFDGSTGEPAILLFDNALLTHHRTAAAGAVGAKLLARPESASVLVVGVGTQGTLQVDYLLRVLPGIEAVTALARKQDAVDAYVRTQSEKHPGVRFRAARDLTEAGPQADIIITTTPSRRPVLMVEHVRPGTHVNAIGSDNPGKQELDPALLARAVYVTDSTAQCARNGELQHAIAAGLMTVDDVHAEIGAIVVGDRPGRTDAATITVFDSTGLGAQDLAIANLVYGECRGRGLC